MFDKIRTAIVSPQGLILYRKDRLIKALFYVFLFALLMAAVPALDANLRSDLTPDERALVRDNYVRPDENCAILNATLVCEGEAARHTVLRGIAGRQTMTGLDVTLDSHQVFDPSGYERFRVHLVVHDETAYMVVMGNVLSETPLADYEMSLTELNFTYDEAQPRAFYDAFLVLLDQSIYPARGFFTWVNLLASAIGNFLLFNVFVLLNAFLTRLRIPQVPFKQMYVMMSYAATMLFVVMIFHELFSVVYNISFFIFIIALFLAFRQMNRLSMELFRRIYRQ